MSIEVVGGSFYQDAFGGPTSTSINPLLFPLAPSLEWDTFLTIGALTSVDNNLNQIGMVWDDFEAGNLLATNNGSVFVVPTEPQGELQAFTGSCGQARSGVLIGQFTLLGEGASLMCSVLLQGKDESDVVWQQPMAIDASTDCNGDILDDCQIDASTDCNDDGVLDDCQIDASTDCNEDGVLDECQIDASSDCNGDGVLDDCQIDASTDCNEDGVLDECQIEVSSDCNSDGVLDDCQIDASTDCNGDGVLDECQIEASTDCNEDGVLLDDECQIETVSSDCNSDGVLDECQIDASTDCHGDDILDECQCAADIDQSGVVDVLDLLSLLEAWAETGCADISGDAIVGVDDLVLLIEAWGICVVE